MYAGLVALAFSVAILGTAESRESPAGSVGIGSGIVLPCLDYQTCPGTYYQNQDQTVENAYCWQYGGIAPPYFGAFAECYTANGFACEVHLLLTTLGAPCGPLDIYVWDDVGGRPGNVLSFTPVNPCPVGTWPNVQCEIWPVYPTRVDGPFWVGCAAGAAEGPCGYFVAADLDGPGGCPMTDIAPGIGYPSGWQDVSVVWGPTRALGISVRVSDVPPRDACCEEDGSCIVIYDPSLCDGELMPDTPCIPNPCAPVPVRTNSWGGIKSMYRDVVR